MKAAFFNFAVIALIQYWSVVIARDDKNGYQPLVCTFFDTLHTICDATLSQYYSETKKENSEIHDAVEKYKKVKDETKDNSNLTEEQSRALANTYDSLVTAINLKSFKQTNDDRLIIVDKMIDIQNKNTHTTGCQPISRKDINCPNTL